MSAHDTRVDAQEELEQAAGRWLARRDRGLTADEETAFRAWLAADPRHGAALEELEGPFHAMDRAGGMRPPTSAPPDPDLLLRMAKSRPTASDRTLARFPRWLAVGAGLAAAVALGFFVWRAQSGPETIVQVRGSVVRHTPDRLPLEDGSLVEMKPGAKVEVAFTPAERRVRLVSGEAHFTVAKNAARPFVVVAGEVAVQAVGTAFNVRLAPAEVEVLVTEGRVRVDDAVKGGSLLAVQAAPPATDPSLRAGEPVLTAGERVIIPIEAPAPAMVALVDKDEAERALAWRSLWLEFNEMPLADVTREFNRHNERPLEVADEATGRILVSGNFKADGTEAFVRILESTFGVTARRAPDGSVSLQRTP